MLWKGRQSLLHWCKVSNRQTSGESGRVTIWEQRVCINRMHCDGEKSTMEYMIVSSKLTLVSVTREITFCLYKRIPISVNRKLTSLTNDLILFILCKTFFNLAVSFIEKETWTGVLERNSIEHYYLFLICVTQF